MNANSLFLKLQIQIYCCKAMQCTSSEIIKVFKIKVVVLHNICILCHVHICYSEPFLRK
jgi:hypothetical protein